MVWTMVALRSDQRAKSHYGLIDTFCSMQSNNFLAISIILLMQPTLINKRKAKVARKIFCMYKHQIYHQLQKCRLFKIQKHRIQNRCCGSLGPHHLPIADAIAVTRSPADDYLSLPVYDEELAEVDRTSYYFFINFENNKHSNC